MSRIGNSRALLWHWDLNSPAELLAARPIVRSAEEAGLVVFPSSSTCWHYNDKLAQKYLLEAVDAPLIPTYVFFDKIRALDWIAHASYPKVFKLRCGAGSTNVRLVTSRSQAEALCHKAFGSGFVASHGYLADLRHKMRRVGSTDQFIQKLRRLPTALASAAARRNLLPRERGYILFQDFLADNAFDTRVTVIGNRAFGFRRFNRSTDFRASGSGLVEWSPEEIDRRCVELAFSVSHRLKTQSLAFDFLFDANREPRIAEVSYAFVAKLVHDCPGHWDREYSWHPGHIWPQDAILDDVLSAIGLRRRQLE
jgi:glutathione synthase/RimK-type ligase-like ATP-grasp enzyme